MLSRAFLFLFLFVFAPSLVRSQVIFTSPLPFGILQVHDDHADLRLHVSVVGYSTFSYKISSDTDTSSPKDGWAPISIRDDMVDTLLTVPKSLRDYSIYWRAGLGGTDTGGIIARLTPGHIIGVAGQSNAVGWVWPPPGQFVAVAKGDIRMLTNDTFWQPAGEPTDGVAQGPWIEMANELYAKIGDTLPIGIVNVAIGGSGILFEGPGGLWKRNNANPEDNSLYGNALRRFRAAGDKFECLTWIQGETEAAYFPYLFNPQPYRDTFEHLMSELRNDLSDSFPIFHLQVGGWTGTHAPSFPMVHEAQRVLPLSTLVGTALGRAVQDTFGTKDGVHYTVETYIAVGHMFAAAVLKELYGIDSPMYPPLMPDTVARLDSVLDGSILGKYCFTIRWNRGGAPVHLVLLRPVQYFAVEEDGVALDTSEVWARISPQDPSRILLGLRNDSVTSNHDWRITYDATSEANHAPLATIDPISGDTIFATAFYELPVELSSGPLASVKEFNVQSVMPNPAANAIHCYIYSYKHETLTIELLDNLGKMVHSESAVVENGEQDISISTDGLASGTYWIALRDENGNESIQKAVFFH